MGKFGGAVFAVLLAALVLFAGCVGKTGGLSGSPSASPSGSPSASEENLDGVSQEEFSSLESELAGLDGNESLFVADEFESDILG